MANKNLTIPEPTATTAGYAIHLTNTATGRIAYVTYDPGPGLPTLVTHYSETEVTNAPVAIRNAISTLFTQVTPNANTRMGF